LPDLKSTVSYQFIGKPSKIELVSVYKERVVVGKASRVFKGGGFYPEARKGSKFQKIQVSFLFPKIK
jgi:hypothetical protein